MLEIGAKDVMAMLDLIDDGGELAPHPAVQAGSEDRGNLVGGEPRHRPSSQLRSNSL